MAIERIVLSETEADAHTQAHGFFATVDDFASARKLSPLTMLWVAALIVQSCQLQMIGPEDDDYSAEDFEKKWQRFICYITYEDLLRGIYPHEEQE